MIKVLFVCHGNICRSPMAEFIFKDMVARRGIAEQFHISSAATSQEEIGNPVYPPAVRELARHGISAAGKRAVQLRVADYGKYDLLLAMEQYNRTNMMKILKEDRRAKSGCCWTLPISPATSPIPGTMAGSTRPMRTSAVAAKDC